jgi:hypothetical protein
MSYYWIYKIWSVNGTTGHDRARPFEVVKINFPSYHPLSRSSEQDHVGLINRFTSLLRSNHFNQELPQNLKLPSLYRHTGV